jgi:hypothetical protein
MFNMDAPCTFHIRKVSPSVLGRLLCPSQYHRRFCPHLCSGQLGTYVGEVRLTSGFENMIGRPEAFSFIDASFTSFSFVKSSCLQSKGLSQHGERGTSMSRRLSMNLSDAKLNEAQTCGILTYITWEQTMQVTFEEDNLILGID